MGRIVSLDNSIEINEIGELDAVFLLLKASCLNPSDEHLEAARKIVNELGCIPLAVNHAGAYIKAGKCNIDTYLRQFFLDCQTLMTDDTFKGSSDYNQTVYGTWDLSFKEIERRAGQLTSGNAQAAQSAILLLRICAFYHYTNISKAIFRPAAEKSREYGDSDFESEGAGKLPPLLGLDNDGQWDEYSALLFIDEKRKLI